MSRISVVPLDHAKPAPAATPVRDVLANHQAALAAARDEECTAAAPLRRLAEAQAAAKEALAENDRYVADDQKELAQWVESGKGPMPQPKDRRAVAQRLADAKALAEAACAVAGDVQARHDEAVRRIAAPSVRTLRWSGNASCSNSPWISAVLNRSRRIPAASRVVRARWSFALFRCATAVVNSSKLSRLCTERIIASAARLVVHIKPVLESLVH